MAFRRTVSMYNQYIAGVGCAVVVGVSIYPHTLGLNQYRKVLAQYKDGKEVAMDKRIEQFADNLAYQIKMTADQQAGLMFFTCFGHDMIHKGSVHLKTGAYVGIPAIFSYDTVDQVPKDEMQLNNASIPWDTEAGQQLLDSIILSPSAKLFAIAREICYVNKHYVWIDSFLKCAFYCMAYTSGFMLNTRLNLKARMKPWARGGLFSIVGGIFFFLYLTASDTYFCYLDDKVDTETASFGEQFAAGGVEFYSKVLQRNQALRKLMGKEGENMYTLFGNHVGTWRMPHVQLTVRRNNLNKHLENYRKM